MMISPNVSEQEIKNFKALLDYFKQLAEDGVNPLIEKQLLLMLDHAIPFYSHLIREHIFPEIQRITVNKKVLGVNHRIHKIAQLKYPPAEKVNKYGRCNFKKQSVFYGTFNLITALNETQPKIGDLITKSTWRVKGDQTLKYCPIFKNQPRDKRVINERTWEINEIYELELERYPENVKKLIDTLVQFVADAFTKRVHSSNDLDYIFSAYFSNKILNEFENNTIEAIYYPSIHNDLSFENIVIKPGSFDTKYELIKVSDSVCVTEPGVKGSGYFSEGISECKSFDYATGNILWDSNKINLPDGKLLEYKLRYGIEIAKQQVNLF